MKKTITLLAFLSLGIFSKAQIAYYPIQEGQPQTVGYDSLHTKLSQNFYVGIYKNDTLIGVTDISQSSAVFIFPSVGWDSKSMAAAIGDSLILYISEKKYTTFK